MDQQIRFCEVGAGRIAYATVGEGSPVVLPTWWMGHLELTWENARFRRFVEALASRHTVVRYDPLGTGLSERARADADFSLAVELEVLGRVVAHAGLDRFSLLGFSSGGPLAIAYAAGHPERITRLILYGAYADGGRITDERTRQSLVHMVREHWGLGSRVLTSVFLPETESEEARWFTEVQRRAADPAVAARLLDLVYRLDVTAALADVLAPTLVLHRRDDRTIPYELGVELAAGIPEAELRTLEGDLHFPWLGDTTSLLTAIGDFTHVGPYALPDVAAGAPESEDRDPLSERECEVLALVAEGLSDAEIAGRLILSPHTIHRHVANIRAKLGQPSRAAAVAEGSRRGLI